MTTFDLVFLMASPFIGSFLGAVLGSRFAWRQTFVTREEAIEMARAIDAQTKALKELHKVVYGDAP